MGSADYHSGTRLSLTSLNARDGVSLLQAALSSASWRETISSSSSPFAFFFFSSPGRPHLTLLLQNFTKKHQKLSIHSLLAHLCISISPFAESTLPNYAPNHTDPSNHPYQSFSHGSYQRGHLSSTQPTWL